MALSIFDNKQCKPEEADLAEAMGEAKRLWDEVREYITKNYSSVKEEWKFYTKKSGWGLVVKSSKRTILYMYPSKNFFTTVFVFGERAVSEAEATPIPQEIMDSINSAKPYMEGRSFNVEVHTDDNFEHIKTLMKIKMNN